MRPWRCASPAERVFRKSDCRFCDWNTRKLKTTSSLGSIDDEHPDISPTGQGRACPAGARRSLFHAAEGFSSRRATVVPGRYAVALVRAAAQGRAGALLHQRADRALLVGDQI